jgi:natural product biosynthesis luciferase-like monooxygenase protein/amino acid adenylation domain-containing protein
LKRTPHTPTTLVAVFARQAHATPSKVALYDGTRTMTFAELDGLSNQIAATLCASGIRPADRVAVSLQRSIPAIAILIGIMKAGAAYVPVPAALPAERRRFMLEDSGPTLIIEDEPAAVIVGIATIGTQALLRRSAEQPITFVSVALDCQSIAWVLYTSGSTGVPKGVLGTHAGCVNRIQWLWERFPFLPDEVAFQNTAFGTVDSFWEIFAPLGQGHTLRVFRDQEIRDIERLIPLLHEAGVRRICLVPSLLETVLALFPDLGARLPQIKYWVVSGEPLPVDLVRRFYGAAPSAVMLNQYGLTESCADVSWYDTRAMLPAFAAGKLPSTVPIGHPISYVEFLLLDEQLQAVPQGDTGELFISGSCLAAGYLNRPDESAMRFLKIAHPVTGEQCRVYRTGDRVRLSASGEHEYCGRIDRQVKIRGFRVELDEIEKTLASTPGVEHAAVDALGSATDRRLIAWVAPVISEERLAEVNSQLRQRLPIHMIPQEIRCLATLPRTTTGKIDRASLAEPEPAQPVPQSEYPAADPEVVNWLRSCWSELLGRDVQQLETDFFAAGGDSLIALRLLSRIRTRFGQALELETVFDHSRLVDLAQQLTALGPEAPKSAAEECVLTSDASAPAEMLSFAQERLHALAVLRGEGSAVHNVGVALRVQGELDANALELAFDDVSQQHVILRSRLVEVEDLDTDWRCVPDAASTRFTLARVNARCDESLGWDAHVRSLFAAELARPFDLAAQWPMRAVLTRMAAREHALLVVFHQSVTDDWSMSVFGDALSAAYCARIGHGSIEKDWPFLPYAAHAAAQRSALQGEHLVELRRFWHRNLAGAPAQLALPTDFPRPPRPSRKGARVEFVLAAADAERLRKLADRANATPFMVILAAYHVFLARYTGQWDVVVGSPVAQRDDSDQLRSIGCFINMLPFRARLDPRRTFGATLRQARADVLSALQHRDLPFEQILECAEVQRSLAFEPLFQTIVTQRLGSGLHCVLPGAQVGRIELPTSTCEYDLELWLEESAGTIAFQLDYSTDLFVAATVERMEQSFLALLRDGVSNPDREIGQLAVLTEAQLGLLRGWQGPRKDWSGDGLLARVQRCATSHPRRPALSHAAVKVDYGQLWGHVEELAGALNSQGIGSGHTVAVLCDRTVWLPVALLAVLRSGASYLPLDPRQPAGRIGDMLVDAAVCAIVSDLPSHQQFDCHAVFALGRGTPRASRPVALPAVAKVHADVAYVIYTSGSTGRPKGVEVRRSGLDNLILDMVHRVPIVEGDVVTAVTPISFDIAALELFGPLAAGALVHIVGSDVASDGEMLARALEDAGTTMLQATPSTWRLLLDTRWRQPVRFKALCGGEALPIDVASALDRIHWTSLNVYGPTETTIWSTCARIGGRHRPSIGRPLANTNLRIVDREGRLSPIGSIGELWIGGAGVASGYHGQPELTAQRFIDDPVGSVSERWYRTGDLVRFALDGELEYVGRDDDQVKLRGHRIEPAEIETAMANHPSIDEVAVVVDGQRLIAHVVPVDGATPSRVDFSLFFFGASAQDGSAAYRLYLEAARRADAAGFKAVWTPERHFHDVGGPYPSPSVLSAALAATTQSIQLRAGSVVLPLHDPIRVAEEWAIIDQLSQGRVGISVASGWNPRDFVLHPERFADRKQSLFTQIKILQDLWRGSPYHALDGNGAMTQVTVYPRPVQANLPVWVTAAGPTDVFVRAGNYGANVLTHLLGQDVDGLAANIEAYRRARAQSGLDPSTGVVTLMLHTFVADTDDDAKAISRGPFLQYLRSHLSLDLTASRGATQFSAADEHEIVEAAWRRYSANTLIGSEAHCLALVRRLTLIGVDEFACLIDFGVAAAAVLEHLPHLARLQRKAKEVSTSPDLRPLREYLAHILPDYMLPDAFVVSDTLPRTANGKLDRKALTKVAIADTTPASRPPATATEEALLSLWQEVLGRPILDVTTNFFACGGHSILASRLMVRVRGRFHLPNLPLRSLFDHPSVEAMAAAIDVSKRASSLELTNATPPAASLADLSFGQERLVFLHELVPNKALYNTPVAVRVRGTIDEAALQRAVDLLQDRHPLLRATIVLDGGRPLLRENPDARLHVETSSTEESDIEHTLAAIASRPFDLSAGPMFRVHLVQLSTNDHILAYVIHHAISDGGSIAAINRDLRELYASVRQGREPRLSALPYNYADFVAAQREGDAQGRLEISMAYWLAAMRNLPDQLDLAGDSPRPPEPSYNGAHVTVTLPAEETNGLRRLAAQRNASLFMVVAALLNALLHRYTGCPDIALGVPVSLRPEEADGVVGMFLNTLLLRTDCSGEPSFLDLIGRVRDAALKGYGHQEVPFEQVVSRLDVRRDPSRHPLFQVMLVMHDADEPTLDLVGMEVDPVRLQTLTAKFDLTLAVEDGGRELRLDFEYATDIYEEQRIKRMAEHLLQMAQSACANPGTAISRLQMLDRHGLRAETVYRQAQSIFANPVETVHGLVLRRARSIPLAQAVIDRSRSLSYQELIERSSALAALLRTRGVVPGDRVGICMSRGVDLVVALVGVLQAGAAYVPLDPNYPTPRLRYMLSDSRARLLVTEPTLPGTLALDIPAVYPDEWNHAGVQVACDWPDTPGGAVSHVIYTSGSTGQPKGVSISHANTVSMLKWALQTFPAASLSGTLACTSVCFDLSLFEIFAPLAAGGMVILAENFLDLVDHPAAAAVTLCNTVPSVMEAFLNSAILPPQVRIVNLAGEPLSRRLSDRVYAQPGVEKLYNLYGPTECTTYSTMSLVSQVESRQPCIGRPLTNTTAYVLDKHLQPVPEGVPGELHLGGAGVAQGYVGAAAQTASKFLPNEYAAEPGARMYATGDLVRWNSAGELDYLGRIDRQVKLHGFRIELGEIDASLLAQPGVRSAVTSVWQGPHGPRLVAYLVRSEGLDTTEDALKRALEQRLPAIMIPAAWVWMPSFPLTPNGKIDVKALPPPQPTQVPADKFGKDHVDVGPHDQQVLAAWRDVLGERQLSTDDNFFDVGGSSLLLIQLRARLQERTGHTFTVVELLRLPTVRSQAQLLRPGDAIVHAVTALEERVARRRQATSRQHTRGEGLSS